jgi:hypothetical protein
VRWFPGRPGPDATVLLVRPDPGGRPDLPWVREVSSGMALDQEFAERALQVTGWAQANKQALLRFWNGGGEWFEDEVDAWVEKLIPWRPTFEILALAGTRLLESVQQAEAGPFRRG